MEEGADESDEHIWLRQTIIALFEIDVEQRLAIFTPKVIVYQLLAHHLHLSLIHI